MRNFVAEVFLANMDPDWFQDYSQGFPLEFTHHLCATVLRKMKRKSNYKKILRSFTDRNYRLAATDDEGNEDESEDDEEDEDDD